MLLSAEDSIRHAETVVHTMLNKAGAISARLDAKVQQAAVADQEAQARLADFEAELDSANEAELDDKQKVEVRMF